MGLFSKLMAHGKEEVDTSQPPQIVIAQGKVHGLTKLKRRGYIQETGSEDSLFFQGSACADFDKLEIGQNVEFTKETDPLDRGRTRAIDVHMI